MKAWIVYENLMQNARISLMKSGLFYLAGIAVKK